MVQIGQNCSINHHVFILGLGGVEIGNNVTISKGVSILDGRLHYAAGKQLNHISEKIEIEDNCWVAANAILLGGIKIGENSIVAAGSVVSKSVPPNSLVAGIPARIMKQWD